MVVLLVMLMLNPPPLSEWPNVPAIPVISEAETMTRIYGEMKVLHRAVSEGKVGLARTSALRIRASIMRCQVPRLKQQLRWQCVTWLVEIAEYRGSMTAYNGFLLGLGKVECWMRERQHSLRHRMWVERLIRGSA